MTIGLKGNTDGSGAVQIGGSDAITISTGLNTTFAGTVTATGTVAGSTGTLYPLTSGTEIASTSGTALDFTDIPSWVKRITVMFSFVSTNGTSNLRLRIGPVGGVETSSYSGTSTAFASTSLSQIQLSAGVDINDGGVATASRNGHVVFTLLDSATNTWAFSGNIGQGDTVRAAIVGGSKSLAGALSIVRITTVNGTDTFDAGSINILFE
jgi:hypothetical protein